jgi:hypothetical protein
MIPALDRRAEHFSFAGFTRAIPQVNCSMMQDRFAARGFILGALLSALVGLLIGAARAEDLANKPPLDAPAAASNDGPRQGAELPANAAPRSEAAEAWDAVKDTTNPALLEAFVKRYRNTFFAVIAMARLAELREAATAKTSPFGTLPAAGPVPTSPIHPGPAIPTDGTQPRAVLYDEDPSNPVGRQFAGSVIWRTEPVKAEGRPDELAARADVDVPSRGLRVTISFRRNLDPSLPASHVIDLSFQLSADTGGAVGSVPGILMKSNEQARGMPLAGLAVKVTGGLFLVGLSNVAADRERNLKLLLERSWFDIPIVYANQRRGILAIEKGEPGEQVFKAAFMAWGESSAAAQPGANMIDGNSGNAGK